MIKSKRNIIFLLVLCIVIGFFVLLFTVKFNNEKKFYNIIDNFITLIQEKKVDEAFNYVYFIDGTRGISYEFLKEGFEEDLVKGYSINKLEKLNNAIYRFDISLDNKYKTQFKPFIVKMDERWLIILHQDDIPKDILGDLYIERNPNEVNYEDVILP